MNDITLKWSCPIAIKEANEKLTANTRGVYIWGFIKSNSFQPYYVGIAEDIKLRIFQHISRLLGGYYTIYPSDQLENFHSRNSKPIYSPDWPKSLVDFLNRRKEIGPHLELMVE